MRRGTIQWLVTVLAAALLLSACSSDDADPAGTLDDFVTAYNADDLDAVMELFSEDAVIDGRPFEGGESYASPAAVRSAFSIYMDFAAENAWTISNVEVTGMTVTWDQIYQSTISGIDTVCGEGHRAVIEDGKIVSWTWPSENVDCP